MSVAILQNRNASWLERHFSSRFGTLSAPFTLTGPRSTLRSNTLGQHYSAPFSAPLTRGSHHHITCSDFVLPELLRTHPCR